MPKIPDAANTWPRLALSIPDLLRVDETVRAMLLGGKIDQSQPLRIDPRRADEIAALLTCPLLDAACIADILRGRDRKARQPPCRVYLQKRAGGAWQRLPGSAVLVESNGNGEIELSAEWFPRPAEEIVPVIRAAPARPVALAGRRVRKEK